ncbi:MAG: lysophospholipid acyltransferase family protein [Rhodospirillaceae bacterium]
MSYAVAVLRSVLFNLFYIGWTAMLGLLCLPLLLAGSHDRIQACARLWLSGFRKAARILLGLDYRVEGLEHVPQGACLIAAKHQSAFETFVFHALLDDPVYVLKQELMQIPLLGWYMARAGMIGIDRSGGAKALKGMLREAKKAVGKGRQIVIFPEGTRTMPGKPKPYQPGVAALALSLEVPVIPVAVNSGLFWPRNSFVKTPGTITIQILPPLESGLTRKAFMGALENAIEGASTALLPAPEASEPP